MLLYYILPFPPSPSLAREIRGGNAGLLRCGKGTTWEGGQRVPAIAYWPGKILPGKTVEVQWSKKGPITVRGHYSFLLFQLAATVDIFPTVMKVVGAPLPNVTMDGFDMSPIIFENGQASNNYYSPHCLTNFHCCAE